MEQTNKRAKKRRVGLGQLKPNLTKSIWFRNTIRNIACDVVSARRATDNSDIDISQQRDRYDNAEWDQNDALKYVNKRLLELKWRNENASQALQSITGKSFQSNESHKSITEIKAKAAAKLARLTAELKLADTETQHEAAFQNSQRALKKFQLEKGFEIARAEMNALLEIGGLELSELPEESCL